MIWVGFDAVKLLFTSGQWWMLYTAAYLLFTAGFWWLLIGTAEERED